MFFRVLRRGKKGEFFEASAPAGLVSLHRRRQEDGTEDKCAYFSCYFKCGHFLHFLDQQIRRCYQKCAFWWWIQPPQLVMIFPVWQQNNLLLIGVLGSENPAFLFRAWKTSWDCGCIRTTWQHSLRLQKAKSVKSKFFFPGFSSFLTCCNLIESLVET